MTSQSRDSHKTKELCYGEQDETADGSSRQWQFHLRGRQDLTCESAKESFATACHSENQGMGSDSTDADEVEQRALHAQVGKRLMQALEDSICAMLLL
jgi:hypothetical protein